MQSLESYGVAWLPGVWNPLQLRPVAAWPCPAGVGSRGPELCSLPVPGLWALELPGDPAVSASFSQAQGLGEHTGISQETFVE